MFTEMRSALGIPKSVDILDHIYSLPPPEQEAAFQKIRDIESVSSPTLVKLRKTSSRELCIPYITLLLVLLYVSLEAAELTSSQTAMSLQSPQPGLLPLMQYLTSKNLPKGICTRNFDTPVSHLLSKFLEGEVFGPIVTRDFRPPKPDPAGILHIVKTWGFIRNGSSAQEGEKVGDASACIMVGYVTSR